MGRVVIQDPAGRRIAVDEAELGNAQANPFNWPRPTVTDSGPSFTQPGRPLDDHRSLADDGFVVVADLDGDGHEVPRDPELYRTGPKR